MSSLPSTGLTGPLLDKVTAALDRGGRLPDRVVVAVSGGADSVALLRALLGLTTYTRAAVIIAHLNHQLRGVESDADEAFVARLADSLQRNHGDDVALVIERLPIARHAEDDHANLEATARAVRYEWLAQVARTHNAPAVVTGHTADDQAETVLHRLLRGTGIKGLRGIAPRRPLAAGVTLLRPLLTATRAEVVAFLGMLGQEYREDASNADERYTRNRLRHQLLPQLRQEYNPRIDELLGQLADQANEAFGLVEDQTAALLRTAELPRAGRSVILDRAAVAAAAPYLVGELFRLLWQREGWPQNAMGHADWKRLATLVRGALPRLDLPGNVRAQLRERVVQVGPAL